MKIVKILLLVSILRIYTSNDILIIALIQFIRKAVLLNRLILTNKLTRTELDVVINLWNSKIS